MSAEEAAEKRAHDIADKIIRKLTEELDEMTRLRDIAVREGDRLVEDFAAYRRSARDELVRVIAELKRVTRERDAYEALLYGPPSGLITERDKAAARAERLTQALERIVRNIEEASVSKHRDAILPGLIHAIATAALEAEEETP